MSSGALHDRVVVIIGGTTGLGLSAARACMAAGAKVVVCGRNGESVAAAQAEVGANGIAFVGDAQDSATAVEAIRHAENKFGRFDALYHVAGGSGRRMGDGPLHEITDDGITATLNLNLASAITSNRAAVQAFLRNNTGGVVLNMGSVLGCSPAPHHFATHVYAAAKSAINGFTKSCAAYYAPHNIRFNVVAPALVETPMAQRAVANDDIMQYVRHKQPLAGGRAGLPQDLDGAVVFLLSDAARYITGQVLAVDGGWSVSEGAPRHD